MKITRQFLPILFIASAALLAVMAFATDGVEGRTIIVDDDGGADYEKIQDAINASEDGDTVRVWEGVYYENVVVNKSINLIGNESESTTINGSRSKDVVRITADWVNLSGFSVTGRGIYEVGLGIEVESGNNHIFSNNCSNNMYGIFIRDSRNCTITNNTCSNNLYGIYLDESRNCTIENNTMNENGISISGSLGNWTSHTVETTNTVNGKPLYFYKNVTGLTVPYGAGQVILANCTWINVENQNCSNGSVGILVGYSSNITITNNSCTNNKEYGINLFFSENNTISNNNCSNNGREAIYLYYSSHSTISNNNCSNNRFGIHLWYSDNNRVECNTCSENIHYGIYLQDSGGNAVLNNNCSSSDISDGIRLWLADNNTISNNICLNNSHGIELNHSDHNAISNNTCSNNGAGINLVASNHNKFQYNNCSNNRDDGISISGHSNTISHNTFCYNSGNGMDLRGCNNTISYNTCSDNIHTGIYLIQSDYNTILNSTCSNNNDNGIKLLVSSNNTISNNTCSNNDDGIDLRQSDNNTLTKNTISNNTVGIRLKDRSKDNTVHYNPILNNTECGINATENDGITIDATYNWWDDDSGPYHPTENPDGTGDNVTDHVEFGPWLKEPAVSDNEKPEVEKNETDFIQHLCLSSLILILVSLFVLLIIMVYLPGNHFTQNGKSSITDENTDESSPLPDMINTCPHCGGKFEIESTKRPTIIFNCNYCGEKVEFK